MSAAAAVGEATILLRTLGDGCVALGDDGDWLLLTPLSVAPGFHADHLKRWDRVRFAATAKANDARPELRHVAAKSLQFVRESTQAEQEALLARCLVTGLGTGEGRTLALLQPRDVKFAVERKTGAEFGYGFRYSYATDDGSFKSPYRDREMDTMLANLKRSYGEAQTVARIIQVYGKEYPARGMLFVMSRDGLKQAEWTIAGVVIPEAGPKQIDLSSLDLVV